MYCACGVVLSFPMLLLLMQASSGFQKQEDFMWFPLLYFSMLVHSVIPQGILRRYGGGISFLDSYVMGRDDNLVCYMGAVGILLFAVFLRAVFRFLKRVGEMKDLRMFWEELREEYERAAGWSCEKKTAAGCAAARRRIFSV